MNAAIMSAANITGLKRPRPASGQQTFVAALMSAMRAVFSLKSAAAPLHEGLKQNTPRQSIATTTAMMVTDAARSPSQIASITARDTLAKFQRDIVPHMDAAYNFARFLSRDPDAAEDIAQDSFLRAFRAFDGYEGGDARAWIFAIVRNCYYDWLNVRRRRSRIELDVHRDGDAGQAAIENVPASDDSPEAALLRQSEAARVRGVLDSMPRSLREMLVLRELEGLSYFQIAKVAAVPIGTVMSRLARARKQFQAAWQNATTQQADKRISAGETST
jgi:RNA polymerase sigma-70 factor (ECF subfamily)